MTTVAVDLKNLTVVADSAEFQGTVISNKRANKFVVGKRFCLAFTGAAAACHFANAVVENKPDISLRKLAEVLGEKFDAEDYSAAGICLDHDARIVEIQMGIVCYNGLQVFAVGHGKEFAWGALYTGANPVTAVKAAINYDVYTGGKVRQYEYDEENKTFKQDGPCM